MIYFLLVWLLLTMASYLLGTFILKSHFSQSLKRMGDRVILALWLGVIILANLFLVISLILPLSFGVGIVIIIGCIFLCLLSSTIRQEIILLKSRLSLNYLIIIFILTWLVALFTTKQVTWIESGWYHYSAMRWLSEFGVVQGIVLTLKNLGITSSWFALIAPFNGQIVEFRAGAVINSFIFLVTLVHLSLSVWRGLRGKAYLCDWFAISFSCLFLIYLAVSQEMQLILISLSPDLPIALLIGMTAWAILVDRDQDLMISKESIFKQNLSFVPFLLGTGAVTIKLSAAPLLLITGLFYVWQEKKSIGRLTGGILVIGLLILPILLVGIKTSGCPLYPSSLFCLDVPWSLALEDTQEFASKTSSLETWFGEPPVGQNSRLWFITKWVTSRSLNLVMMVLALLSLVSFIWLFQMLRKRSPQGQIWVSALGLLGIIFIFLQGPLIRFGLGYLLILPALSLATFLERKLILKNKFLTRLEGVQNTRKVQVFFLLLLGALISIGLTSSNLLLPSPLASKTFIQKQVNDVIYFSPLDGACWASALPCSRSINQVRLRNPDLGIQGGFERTHE